MSDKPKPYVILLTDRRALGQPIKIVSRKNGATEEPSRAKRFETEADAKKFIKLGVRREKYTPTVATM